MSIRTFVFCDTCNPQAIRVVSSRRNLNTTDKAIERRQITGRRNSDGRAWFEGSLDEAIKQRWVLSVENTTLCPNCAQKDLMNFFNSKPNSNAVDFKHKV